ncbi:hypothetical protein CTAYLR_000098 [Chrysophaeum taylorii]|uniref:A to I editase domain-containing protein n=1 Tax=Chrysophaeum taylorii TaxID=2483200 RepID=A0AAD7UIR5_9STRA|nr:hypothetical protein CTAYLR_000098 [Chrysophaeum taylorii]
MRHAEKSRPSTHPLADAIARSTLEVFRAHACPVSAQTVVASIVAVSDDGGVRVLAYGVGTKVAALDAIKADTTGEVVRDAHAEVLARRGFVRYCYETPSPLRAGERLALYASSAPCGNSTIRRWARRHAGTHAPILVHAAGQVDLLLKKHPGAAPEEAPAWMPKGCCRAGTSSSSSHSCSDKVARWVALGLQGALLSPRGKMELSLIVVGRKYSFEHVRRAVCCRVRKLGRHPDLAGTGVKLDDGVYQPGCGATFDAACYAWWATREGPPEVLDGRTGRRTDGAPSDLCKLALWRAFGGGDFSTYEAAKRDLAAGWYARDRDTFFASPPFDQWVSKRTKSVPEEEVDVALLSSGRCRSSFFFS